MGLSLFFSFVVILPQKNTYIRFYRKGLDNSMANETRRRFNFRRNAKVDENNKPVITGAMDRNIKQVTRDLNDLIGQMNLSLYGTDRVSDVQGLDAQFNKVLSAEINAITKSDKQDITSFLSQMVSKDQKNNALAQLYNNQFLAMSGDDYTNMQTFIYDAYRNRLLEQSDLHEVASQLIELSEAILITRDAIVSSNVVEGNISRQLNFRNSADDDKDTAINIVEAMEDRFGAKKKIKNFIVPKCLEYGNYYAYTIPYSKIFNDFAELKDQSQYGKRLYGESTILESAFSMDEDTKKPTKDFSNFIDNLYLEYSNAKNDNSKKNGSKLNKTPESPDNVTKEAFEKDIRTILENISVCNESVPLPYVFEGGDSIKEFRESFVNEAGDTFEDKGAYVTERKDTSNPFDILTKSANVADGVIIDSKKKDKKDSYSSIKDCYNKLLSPLEVIPVKIMDTPIGYYYVMAEDITPISGAISSTLYYTRFDEHRKEKTVVDAIASQVVKSFDKKFLMNNLEFKKTIVDCIQYYNLNEKRLKFQFIPVDYITEFKIDEDIDGEGQSMIKKSLFYAKLYLMLLLFKIMSIVINSNDIKVNYLRSSGIDKDVVNQVQEIARIRQSRQINMTDLFSYTTLINKVGNGSEMYIPTGRSGERPIETEILSGQDVPLNSDLLEMLKNSYILATGVPAAIINYLNEADFAKQIEENNTKFNARVVSYQIDFNNSITEWYKKLLKWSTNLDEALIDSFEFTFQLPKTVSTNSKSEVIGAFQTFSDFVCALMFKNPEQEVENLDLQETVRQFKILLAKDNLPMLNIDNLEKLAEKAQIKAKELKLKPDPENGDSGDDDGLAALDDLNV